MYKMENRGTADDIDDAAKDSFHVGLAFREHDFTEQFLFHICICQRHTVTSFAPTGSSPYAS